MGLFGGGSVKTKSEPWGAQQDYLKKGFQSASDIYFNQGDGPTDFYANLTPDQLSSIDFTRNFVNGVGGQIGGMLNNTAIANAGNGAQYGSQAQNLFTQFSGGDPTQTILANAAQYANNPFLEGQIDAANRDVQRSLTEDALPSNARAASITGNTNSSRTGVTDAILTRGAQDRMADTAASMRSAAYNQGLGLASGNYFNNAGLLLDANDAVGKSIGVGQTAAAGAQAYNQNNNAALFGAGAAIQADQQGDIQGQIDQMNYPWQQLNNYMGVVGSNNWGGSTSQSGGGPGLAQGLLGTGLALAPAIVGGATMGPAGFMAGMGVPGTMGSQQMPTNWGAMFGGGN